MAVGIFAQPKLPDEMLPVPTAVATAHRLADEAGEVEQDSVELVHGVFFLSTLSKKHRTCQDGAAARKVARYPSPAPRR